MYLKIGDLKLLKIEVVQNGVSIYEGMVENVPDELKEVKYKSSKFDSDKIILEI